MTKRTNDILTSYEFNQHRQYVIVTIKRPYPRQTRTIPLFDASYARFVALANNSKRIFLSILDHGQIGWRISRKPIVCEHNYYVCCPFGCDPNGVDMPQEQPADEVAQPARPA